MIQDLLCVLVMKCRYALVDSALSVVRTALSFSSRKQSLAQDVVGAVQVDYTQRKCADFFEEKRSIQASGETYRNVRKTSPGGVDADS
jgi:hypothetical protein